MKYQRYKTWICKATKNSHTLIKSTWTYELYLKYRLGVTSRFPSPKQTLCDVNKSLPSTDGTEVSVLVCEGPEAHLCDGFGRCGGTHSGTPRSIVSPPSNQSGWDPCHILFSLGLQCSLLSTRFGKIHSSPGNSGLTTPRDNCCLQGFRCNTRYWYGNLRFLITFWI